MIDQCREITSNISRYGMIYGSVSALNIHWNVTLDHKTSHKGQFYEIEISDHMKAE